MARRPAWRIVTVELELGPSFCPNSAVPATRSHSYSVKAATGPLAQWILIPEEGRGHGALSAPSCILLLEID